MNLRNLAVAAAGSLMLALTSFAQVTTIEGIVKGTDGKPLEKAEVHIIRTDIKANYKTKTDKKGHYLVKVEHVRADGVKAVARLHVRVGMD